MFKKLLLKLSCLLSGHDEGIVLNNSIKVKHFEMKTLGSILTVMSIWFLVGTSFASLYICNGNSSLSLLIGLALSIIVLLFERQFTLSIEVSKTMYWIRVIIAILMSLIGSIMVDQYLFKQDVEKYKTEHREKDISNLSKNETNELNSYIVGYKTKIDSLIKVNKGLQAKFDKHPRVRRAEPRTSHKRLVQQKIIDDDGTIHYVNHEETVADKAIINWVDNPVIKLIDRNEKKIEKLETKIEKKEKGIKDTKTKSTELYTKNKGGIFEDVNIIFKLCKSNFLYIVLWCLFFLVILSFELSVLFSQSDKDKKTYTELIDKEEELLNN